MFPLPFNPKSECHVICWLFLLDLSQPSCIKVQISSEDISSYVFFEKDPVYIKNVNDCVCHYSKLQVLLLKENGVPATECTR